MTDNSQSSGSNGSNLPGPGAGLTFLYYFSMTVAISIFAGSQGLNLPIGTVALYRYGIVLGVVAGSIGTYFNRTASFDVSVQDASAFKKQLEQVLADLGFELDPDTTTEQDNYTVYRRSGLSRTFSGAIFVAYRPKTTQIVSRAAMLRKLQQRL